MSNHRRRTPRDQTHSGNPSGPPPLALHIRTQPVTHPSVRQLPDRGRSEARRIAARPSSHAPALLRLRSGESGPRSPVDPGLPRPPRPQTDPSIAHASPAAALKESGADPSVFDKPYRVESMKRNRRPPFWTATVERRSFSRVRWRESQRHRFLGNAAHAVASSRLGREHGPRSASRNLRHKGVPDALPSLFLGSEGILRGEVG
jgi:hypothetical protein